MHKESFFKGLENYEKNILKLTKEGSYYKAKNIINEVLNALDTIHFKVTNSEIYHIGERENGKKENFPTYLIAYDIFNKNYEMKIFPKNIEETHERLDQKIESLVPLERKIKCIYSKLKNTIKLEKDITNPFDPAKEFFLGQGTFTLTEPEDSYTKYWFFRIYNDPRDGNLRMSTDLNEKILPLLNPYKVMNFIKSRMNIIRIIKPDIEIDNQTLIDIISEQYLTTYKAQFENSKLLEFHNQNV